MNSLVTQCTLIETLYSERTLPNLVPGYKNGGRSNAISRLQNEDVDWVICDSYACFAGFIADSAGEYRPAFFTAGGIMVFGSSLVVLKKFMCTRARNYISRTPEHSETTGHHTLEAKKYTFEFLVCEREKVL